MTGVGAYCLGVECGRRISQTLREREKALAICQPGSGDNESRVGAESELSEEEDFDQMGRRSIVVSEPARPPTPPLRWGKLHNQIPIPDDVRIVALQVYDLVKITRGFGLPLYHLGVEVYGLEYYFCDIGIAVCCPGAHEHHVHRERVPLGYAKITRSELWSMMRDLREMWAAGSYNIVRKNCQTFALSFVDMLGLRGAVPRQYIARPEKVPALAMIAPLLADKRTMSTSQCAAHDWHEHDPDTPRIWTRERL